MWTPLYQREDNFPLSPFPTAALTKVWRVATEDATRRTGAAVTGKRTDDAFTLSLRIRGAIMPRAGKPDIAKNSNVVQVDLTRLGGQRNGNPNRR